MVTCPECKGKGWKRDWFACITTLGIAPLMDSGDNPDRCMSKDRCWRCEGKGFIEIK